MFIIILGRWILPKGNISHSALSQLLLVYLSLASDILDLLTLFNEKEIQISPSMVRSVLTVFSLCMLQFALNLTATRGRSFHAELGVPDIEIHQSAPSQRPVLLLSPKPASRYRQILSKILSRSESSPATEPSAHNQPVQTKLRATTVSLHPPDIVIENMNATTTQVEFQLKPKNLIDSLPNKDRRLVNSRLSVGSLYSMQSFHCNSTRTKRMPRRMSVNESVKYFVQSRLSKFIGSEIWSILVTLALQDGPFFAIRLTAIIVYHVRSFLTYFFTFKNFLILIFQTYRIASICLEKDEQEQEFKEKINTMKRMSATASQLGIPLHKRI
ncbi:unnamed protein product [Adineta steineri]|uniref:Uncharacterized protein n=1 Tax=Adineta steineri TaxID=433720 RepID=A0A816E8U5_9BILA|nr:unnamed protein product [Adineta steineri]CAF1647260.1 unnamed protein product [Adineta steineri]